MHKKKGAELVRILRSYDGRAERDLYFNIELKAMDNKVLDFFFNILVMFQNFLAFETSLLYGLL